jgi:hypothetical protein
MPFTSWVENDPAGADAANSIDNASNRNMIRVRERMATVASDWSSATDRIHFHRLFAPTGGFIWRNESDGADLLTLKNSGIFGFPLQPACRIRKAGGLATVDNVYSKVPFDIEDFDVGGLHDNAVNNTRVTIPTDGTGIYRFDFACRAQLNPISSSVSQYTFQARIRKNNTTSEIQDPLYYFLIAAQGGDDNTLIYHPVNFSHLIQATAAADYYEIEVKVAGASSTFLHDFILNIHKVA